MVGTADATTGSATIWYAKAVTGGSSFTVTSTATGVSHMSIVIMEVSYSGTFAVDGTPGTNHSTSNVTSAAVSMGTAAASNSLAIMVINIFEDEAVTSYALTGSTMATVRQNTSTGSASSVIGTGAGNIASTGAKTATANFASSAYVAAAAMFKATGAVTGTGDNLFAGPF